MERVQFGGWECARFVSGNVELLVTLDVGPRIIRFGFIGGANEMFVKEAELGLKGGDVYRGYGGHRLWRAPEDPSMTYTPDNEAVERTDGGSYGSFKSARDSFGIQKTLTVSVAGYGFNIGHELHFEGEGVAVVAPWALTVMAPSGEAFILQEPHVPHGQELLPARPLVLWTYTEMADPRYTWGNRVVRLRQSANHGPTKFGALVKNGCAAYLNGDRLFVKSFPFDEGAVYPDYNVNFECFTRHDMLEVESLGELKSLNSGETALHQERWKLVRSGPAPDDDAECADWLESNFAFEL